MLGKPSNGVKLSLLDLIHFDLSQMQCLAQLSPAHGEVMDLVYYQDKSIEEVAQIVCVSPNTVKTRMFYAFAGSRHCRVLRIVSRRDGKGDGPVVKSLPARSMVLID